MSSKLITNIGQLAEGIGSYVGMMESLETQDYMDTVLAKSFNQTEPLFTEHAVAQGMRNPERLGHMWQFGTAGITRGPIRFADGNIAGSRLWRAGMTGTGMQKTIRFTMLPATGFVPPLIEEETGVDQEVLDKLKVNTGKQKYRFKNRAFVFESGVDVKLFPKHSKQLFIPIKQEGIPSGWSGDMDKARERGYVWAKSHTYSPGAYADSKGAFTGLFGAWWSGPGAEVMQGNMSKQVEGDLATVATGIGGTRRMTTAKATNIKTMIEKGRRKTRKQFTLLVASDMDEKAKAIL